MQGLDLNQRPPGYEFPSAHAGRYLPVPVSPSDLHVLAHGSSLHDLACHPVISRWVAISGCTLIDAWLSGQVERGCLSGSRFAS